MSNICYGEWAVVLAVGLVISFSGMAQSPPNGAIVGTVTDLNSKVVGAHMTAYKLDVVNGSIEAHATCFVSADKDGDFTCSDIKEGTYVLAFNLPRSHSASPRIVGQQETQKAMALPKPYDNTPTRAYYEL